MKNLIDNLPYLSSELKTKIIAHATLKELPENIEILRQGQYIKVIPIVLSGLIKVFTQHENKELLLYYIKPNESCIMSFTASLKNEPSTVYAITEEPTTALLLPIEQTSAWIKEYPDMNMLFYQQYNLRYSELLSTIHHVLFNKMDQRLFEYLKEKSELTHKKIIKMSHRQIANELGTAREVISRVMKKLETEGKVKQHSNTIEVL